ncbi:ABC transporter substrate-binding protein [Cellulomonas fengjieae]|uniref:Extracellular solute-binding protein n=1 Tax=Cellulomonas fengjieae TaxID=2819978 RepID=A0ABS3SHE3_9CELL|nr:extracellular solute-binding protein [Cellulomonas fengjieae]MBO3085168.1 extracellular solute-binding protein [Cellulomonas fengjieae]MBO3100914.1 extracellular solute-binding protein [Cellulomonas fengjieae]QVI66258.1 extracellular solute-binding protein [Cellulomonas fengjieae]
MSRASQRTRRLTAAASLCLASLITVTACSAPGGTTSDDPEPTAGGTNAAGAPSCGEDDVVLSTYIETGFPLPKALADEFTAQYPNVTFDIREDQFAVITQNAPRVLADSPPDLMRLPQVSELATDGLLLDLDPYAEAFGWDQWPASQLTQMRVDEDGRRGNGPLYAMGLNQSMTGIFYNKDLAAQIGMTEPPATLAELDAVLQKAKDAGITPMAQFNGGATGGFAFPLQGLMASYGDPAAINDWTFQQADARIDTPENLEAAEHLDSWIKAGYFADDVNAMDYATMMSRFIDGKSLLMFNGDWESGNLDAQMAGKVGFFLVPPVEADGEVGAMSAPLTYGVSSQAKNPDCAAFFLDWIATNEEARTIGVEIGGSRPMGPADGFMPEVDETSVTAQTLAAGTTIGEDDGAMEFIANATGEIYAKSWTPNLQKLVAGEQTPEGLLTAVQADYEAQIGG